MPSVIIPAHNEATVLGRLLDLLQPRESRPDLETIVVCNGCTDSTATVARSYPWVVVITTEEANKANALRLGSLSASTFPRVFVDADVEIDRAGIDALCAVLDRGRLLAAAPTRRLQLEHSSLPVRLYYEFWQDLPAVRNGLFGRGAIAVSEKGYARLSALPALIADDLAISSSFRPTERDIVNGSEVMVHAPRTWSALLRRRTRAARGTRQFYDEAATDSSVESRTSWSDVGAAVRRRPSNLVRLPVFLAVALTSRRRASRVSATQSPAGWERDDSRGT